MRKIAKLQEQNKTKQNKTKQNNKNKTKQTNKKQEIHLLNGFYENIKRFESKF